MPNQCMKIQFSKPLLAWYDQYGRKELPWQTPRHPYKVWVSEIMLQQTQVQTVIPFFNRFIQAFPTLQDLALAEEDMVLSLWSGLGYYSRARNLHKTAKLIHEQFQGEFPRELKILVEFPGIGESTAAAILSQAFNLPTAILDGNVKRVLTRFFLITGWPEQTSIKRKLWELAQSCMPKQRCADYTQAIMDLGATLCTRTKPSCAICPLTSNCLAFKHDEQNSLPTKRIKKPVAIQQQQFLVLKNERNHIFLEKRPPTGIWGGLWCLPSIELEDCPLEHIKNKYHLSGNRPEPIISFMHKFSHLHLKINAISINAISIKAQALNDHLAESQGHWFPKEKLSSLGLAKPTSLILEKIFDE